MRKPSLSPSKITTYLACPIKYRWTYLDSRGKWYLRSKSTYSFGQTLHRVLERFHDAEDRGVETTHEVLGAYDENWISAGFTSAEEMAEVYGEGKAILIRHVEEAQLRPATSKTLFVEKQMKADLGPFVLVGRVDRVDEHDDGSLEIIDYKSGRESVCEDDVAADIAMACYQLLLRKTYPERTLKATIHCLRSGHCASHQMSLSELEEFEDDIRFIGTRMLQHDYEFLSPAHKPLCRGCDFLPLCSKHEDFLESYANAAL